MSIKVQSYVWEHSKAKGAALLLLLAIADHSHDDGTGAFPGVERLAKYCRQTPRNTQFLIRKLEASGELVVSYGTAKYGTNEYTIPMPARTAAPAVKPAPVQTPEAGGGENFSPLKNRVKGGEKPSPEFSPKPLVTINNPLSIESALESLQTAFEKRGGYLTPVIIERFRAVWDGNPDHRPERLKAALDRLEDARSIWKALDAFREWQPPRRGEQAPKPQRAASQPFTSKTPAAPSKSIADRMAEYSRQRAALK